MLVDCSRRARLVAARALLADLGSLSPVRMVMEHALLSVCDGHGMELV